MHSLAGLGAIARRGEEVLALDVEHHHGVRPGQEVGNDHADALAGAGGGVEHDVLRSVGDEEVAVPPAQDDAAVRPQPRAPLFRTRGPAGGAVQGAAPGEQDGRDEDRTDQG